MPATNSGTKASERILVTAPLPGERWRQQLHEAGYRVDVAEQSPADEAALIALIGDHCVGVIGQLTEPWTRRVISHLVASGGRAFSTYAVGYNNIDVEAASELGLPIGNTPGVLTEATAEQAVALTFAAARHVVAGDRLVRAGRFDTWRADLLLGDLLWRRTVGIVGAGRIGTAYARMLVEGHRMNLVYTARGPKPDLEAEVAELSAFLERRHEPAVTCRYAPDLSDLLAAADVVSIHTPLTAATHHLIGAAELTQMKPSSILVNTSRGPVIDEDALVAHCRRHPQFRAALDVYEREPRLASGLAELDNVVLAPHLGSATRWTRERMSILTARNVIALLNDWPVWPRASTAADLEPFFGDRPPQAAPSVVNADTLGLRSFSR